MENVASDVFESPNGSRPLTKVSFLLRNGAKDLLSLRIFELVDMSEHWFGLLQVWYL